MMAVSERLNSAAMLRKSAVSSTRGSAGSSTMTAAGFPENAVVVKASTVSKERAVMVNDVLMVTRQMKGRGRGDEKPHVGVRVKAIVRTSYVFTMNVWIK